MNNKELELYSFLMRESIEFVRYCHHPYKKRIEFEQLIHKSRHKTSVPKVKVSRIKNSTEFMICIYETVLPDSVETLKATEQLVKLGFVVLPYCQADPTLCKHLEEAGAATVMPLAAPIGTNKGLRMKDFLQIIIDQATVPVVVDAGIGAPSHAAEAMEMGADCVLVNTAIAVAGDPVAMADAFRQAVIAGRQAYEAGLGAIADCAEASSPLTAFLNE